MYICDRCGNLAREVQEHVAPAKTVASLTRAWKTVRLAVVQDDVEARGMVCESCAGDLELSGLLRRTDRLGMSHH